MVKTKITKGVIELRHEKKALQTFCRIDLLAHMPGTLAGTHV